MPKVSPGRMPSGTTALKVPRAVSTASTSPGATPSGTLAYTISSVPRGMGSLALGTPSLSLAAEAERAIER